MSNENRISAAIEKDGELIAANATIRQLNIELADLRESHARLRDTAYLCRAHGSIGFCSDCRICKAIEQAKEVK